MCHDVLRCVAGIDLLETKKKRWEEQESRPSTAGDMVLSLSLESNMCVAKLRQRVPSQCARPLWAKLCRCKDQSDNRSLQMVNYGAGVRGHPPLCSFHQPGDPAVPWWCSATRSTGPNPQRAHSTSLGTWRQRRQPQQSGPLMERRRAGRAARCWG
jgi:hypothetical protein